MISIHTFELTLEVGKEEFTRHRNRSGKHIKYDGKDTIDYSLFKKGITVLYRLTKYKNKIKLIVNPSRMLGYDDLVKLWKPSKKNVSELLCKIEENISDYFFSSYALSDFRLSRIDFTKNIRFEDCNMVSAYVRTLYNIRKVKGYSPKYSKSEEWYNSDYSFDLKGNSNGVEFVAYDKESAIRSEEKDCEMNYRKQERKARIENAKGLLRLEVKLTNQKAIKKYTDKNNTVQRLFDLVENSEEIFFDTFTRVVPFGEFHKKDTSVKIINATISDKTTRRKMLELVELIPIKKSLHLAQKEMNYRKMDDLMKAFAKISLSPVTLSKRQNVKFLPNLYALF